MASIGQRLASIEAAIDEIEQPDEGDDDPHWLIGTPAPLENYYAELDVIYRADAAYASDPAAALDSLIARHPLFADIPHYVFLMECHPGEQRSLTKLRHHAILAAWRRLHLTVLEQRGLTRRGAPFDQWYAAREDAFRTLFNGLDSAVQFYWDLQRHEYAEQWRVHGSRDPTMLTLAGLHAPEVRLLEATEES